MIVSNDEFFSVGSSCAGKTTLAKKISILLNINHFELDSFYWETGWKEAKPSDFCARFEKATQSQSWITCGNFSKFRDLIWKDANLIIWLDPPLGKILMRFLTRSIRRSFKRELLWNGCRENLKNSIFSKNSLLVWILTSQKQRNLTYTQLMEGSDFKDRFVRLQNDDQVDSFLNEIKRS